MSPVCVQARMRLDLADPRPAGYRLFSGVGALAFKGVRADEKGSRLWITTMSMPEGSAGQS